MNKVELTGRLTKDPDLHERSETKVCDMRVAVNGTGKSPTLFIDAAAFGELAETSAKLEKGVEVHLKGSLRYSEWTVKSGDGASKRSRHSVIVRELEPAEAA